MSWVAVVGRGISKNNKTSKKKRIFVGMQVRDDAAMKLDKRSHFKRN